MGRISPEQGAHARIKPGTWLKAERIADDASSAIGISTPSPADLPTMGDGNRPKNEATLLSRLLLLVAIALLPAIAIQAHSEFALRQARQVEVQNQALNLAELAAAELRQ